ncbi:response regulator (plasmid) [Ampullimonas aquatilis]|uniref:ATP-binding response regulator n=1 Tax=Ampullimonas aquatilis TaxID=1341549 RepID=UPI003C77C0E2
MPYSVLIVDDDEFFRMSFSIILNQKPGVWNCIQAGTVKEAAELLSSTAVNIDVAVVDINLPDGTATDVIKLGHNIPFIICTQDDNEPTFEKIFAESIISEWVLNYIVKPIQPNVIWTLHSALKVGYARKKRNQQVAAATGSIEEERKLIAQNLHDAMGSALTQLNWTFSNIKAKAKELENPERTSIEGLCEQGKNLIVQTHKEVSNIIALLRPEIITVAGLRTALIMLVEQWRDTAPSVQFDLQLSGLIDEIDDSKSTVIYRLIQEAVTNSMRHTETKSINIKTSQSRKLGRIEVHTVGKLLKQNNEFEIKGLKERASSLGGHLQFNFDEKINESILIIQVPL